MRTTIRGELSGLGKDLALSDVRLAAVRVLSGRPITPEQMEAAGLLSRMLVSELAILESGVKVPEAAVPREEMRRQIELMLRGLTGPHDLKRPLAELASDGCWFSPPAPDVASHIALRG